MRSVHFGILAALALMVACARVAPADGVAEEGFTPMFNGKDLTGWDGKPGGWRVEDGAITGESTEENPCVKHHYLFWETAQPADFVLRFKYRLVGGNSGVQIRSKKLPDFDAWGYQADMDDENEWTGSLYQHDRGAVVERGKSAVVKEDGTRMEKNIAAPETLLAGVNHRDWNEYEVIARGSRVELRINGALFCEVEDRDEKFACKDGYIALQMHPGPPMKVQFKDLRIKLLD